ncbi:MAG TPA: galactokinase [Anaerolineales bacterium]|nr:galactokinase [Anaerolineales bacterium]
MSLHETIIAKFQEYFGEAPAHVVRAPGRVNLLGEHVDYNDGFVLPIAIDREVWLAFSPGDTNQTMLRAVDLSADVSFTPGTLPAKTDVEGKPLPTWALYPAGVMWALQESGLAIPALKGAYTSNVPQGSGLSSSAAVEMAFVLAWQTLGGWNLPPMERALLGQKAENQYVGVNCGIMDQFASACGEQDRLLHLDCRSLEWHTLPLPNDIVIVIADTKMRRTLTSGEYNKRRADCEEAVRLLSEKLPGIKSLRDVRVDAFNQHASQLPERVEKRARHVVEEIERSERAIPLLEQGNMAEFGRLINQCHASLRDLYEVSIPELDIMARVAQSLPGCYGARLTGAGFGGCTVNVVAREQAEAFSKALAAGYEDETGFPPEIYICSASKGAERI